MQHRQTCSKVPNYGTHIPIKGCAVGIKNEFCINQIELIVKGIFMSPNNWKSWLVAAFAATAVFLPLSGTTQSLEKVLKGEEGRTRLAQESQERIDQVVKKTRSLEDQYKAALKEIEGLKVYNTLLGLQVENQNSKLEDLAESIDQVEVINRQIIPIMTQMIEGLDQFVALDVPFLLEQRETRVAMLRELMERDDVSVAEKFRKVTEAYQIENEYGSTIESYKATLTIDGAKREVDFLRVGRISLMYQSQDGKLSGAWDQPSRQWQALGNEYKNQIKFGLQIAKKQVAPDLVLIPVHAPEAG
jgi:TolA-binding protein